MHDCAPRSVAVKIRASCLYIKVYGFFCATLTDHPGRRNRSRVPARSQATMHGRKQMTTQLDSLRDTAAITALSRQFVYTTMAESGQLDAIRVGSGAVRWRETESPGGHGWLPRCICSEPAHAMSAHCVWRGGEALPLRTPTAARLSPARGRAGGVAPDPFSRWADG